LRRPEPLDRGRLTLLLGAFGDPGHAFPMIALGRALVARGHDVVLQTWRRWRADVEAEGMRFAAAPEYHVFPTRERPLSPYEAIVRAVADTRPLVSAVRPDAIVADVLTLAPALAGELAGVRVATLVPHVDPRGAPGFPPYSLGARLPRTAVGRALWRGFEPLVLREGLERGRRELNAVRERLGLPAVPYVHGGISRALCIVATFPQLEYPRAWPFATHVVGPLLWEPPSDDVDVARASEPLVLVAPSTSQDRSGRLLGAALEGLDGLPVRVLASSNRGALAVASVPENARLVDWVPYSRAMPACDLVVCHGGHGTVALALAAGCVVVVVPAGGDMNENAARVAWAGVGVRLPRRLCRPRPVRLAVQRALAEPALAARARELRAWAATHDAGARAAALVEAFAADA
jgi:UDP:flavonoid glycosyltransferase YjiC (YdhE family)